MSESAQLARQDTPVISIWNYDADNTEAARLAAAHLLLLGHRKIGLVFPPVGGNDRAAARLHAALDTLEEAGIDVPAALSIAGIGDFVGSADMEPPLTTIRIPSKRIGRMAGQTLAAQIMSDDKKVISRAKIDVELMMRGTTAPPGRQP